MPTSQLIKRTKLSELGLGGRLVVSFLVGFAISMMLMLGALYALTHGGGWKYILSLPGVPGFVVGSMLLGGDIGAFIGGLWANAFLYWGVVFFVWQRQIAMRSRGER